jgi:hypothetical protein
MSHFLTVVLIAPPAAEELELAGVRGELKADEQAAAPPLVRDVPIRGQGKALRTYAEEKVAELLAPYDEALEVDEYEIECWCLETGISWARQQLDNEGYTERHQAKIEALRQELQRLDDRIVEAAGPAMDGASVRFASVGGAAEAAIDAVGESPALLSLRAEELRLAEEWRSTHRAWDQRFDELTPKAPGYGKPEPDCDDCKGTGRTMSTSNKEGFWDWWVIGGRWAGVFKPDYDPAMDPRNKERCWLCGGTGRRGDADKLEAANPGWVEATGGCNGCDGTGVAARFHNAEFAGDIVPAAEYLELLRGKGSGASRDSSKRFGIPYALVTPDGAWHGQGKMGWFGCSSDELTDQQWYERAVELVESNPGTLAVACDLHV